MAKKAYVYNGSAWEDLASSVSDLSSYATTVDLDDYQLKSVAGLTLINTTTFSAVSSQSINDVFSATYDNYKILLNFQLTSGGAQLTKMRFRVAGTDNTSANNYWSQYLNDSNGGAYLETGSAQTSLELGYGYAGGLMQQEINIFRPFLAQRSQYTTTQVAITGTLNITRMTTGTLNLDTSFTGFTIFPAASTITGTVSVYGLAK